MGSSYLLLSTVVISSALQFMFWSLWASSWGTDEVEWIELLLVKWLASSWCWNSSCVCKVGDEKWKSGLRWRNNKVVVVLSIVCHVARWPERRKEPILELRYFTVVCKSNGSWQLVRANNHTFICIRMGIFHWLFSDPLYLHSKWCYM